MAAIRTITTISAAPEAMREKGLHYVDVGVSGGVWGLERGYCHMIGGEPDVVKRLDPIFQSLAPALPRRHARQARPVTPGTAEKGYLHCGPNGAGHFVKMVHNGIEYGMMAVYAEGLNIIKHADVGLKIYAADAEIKSAASSRALQIRHRYWAGRGGLASRQRGRVLATRSRRQRVAKKSGSREFRRPRLRFPARAVGHCKPRLMKAYRRR